MNLDILTNQWDRWKKMEHKDFCEYVDWPDDKAQDCICDDVYYEDQEISIK